MMSLDPRTPVIVGVGQQLQRIDNPLEALAPVPFIANAIREATKDAGLSSVPNADSIRVVSFLSWRYRDPAHYIAEELGITTRETVASSMGGNSTQSLINATALEIQSGDFDVVILCGGETSRTRKRARAAEIELPKSKAAADLANLKSWQVTPIAPEESARDKFLRELFDSSAQALAPHLQSWLPAGLGKALVEMNRSLDPLTRFNDPQGTYAFCPVCVP